MDKISEIKRENILHYPGETTTNYNNLRGPGDALTDHGTQEGRLKNNEE
jgi:hypothetical protein